MATAGWTAKAGTPTAPGIWATVRSTAKAGTTTVSGTSATAEWKATKQTIRKKAKKSYFLEKKKLSLKLKKITI